MTSNNKFQLWKKYIVRKKNFPIPPSKDWTASMKTYQNNRTTSPEYVKDLVSSATKYYYENNNRKSIEICTKILDIEDANPFEEIDQSIKIAWLEALQLLRANYEKKKKYDQAKKYGLKLLNMSQAMGETTWQISALDNLCTLAIHVKNYDEAIHFCMQMILVLKTIENPSNMPDAYELLSTLHYGNGDFEESKYYIDLAVELDASLMESDPAYAEKIAKRIKQHEIKKLYKR